MAGEKARRSIAVVDVTPLKERPKIMQMKLLSKDACLVATMQSMEMERGSCLLVRKLN